MENKIQIFNNDQFGQVRVIVSENGEPMFCLSDLCRALDLTNPAVVKTRLRGDLSSTYPITDSLGREQTTTFVKEQGMYKVILGARSNDKTEPFQDWVCGDVLPSIRKNGMYATDITINKMISDPDFAIQLLTNLKDEQTKRRLAESKASLLEEVMIAQAPKVLFANAVETSKKSCLIGELAKILNQNGVDIGQNRLFEWLRNKQYLCVKGESCNLPTQKSMEMGLFEVKKGTVVNADGSVRVTTTTKVTGKGQIYFINKFIS